jgi:hypothetical protein
MAYRRKQLLLDNIVVWMPFKDECGICGRVLSLRYLRRCKRCGKFYCLDCMVQDVSTNDPAEMLCLNCARKIVSPKTISKYDRLRSYLKFRASFTDVVKLSFAGIDGIIGDNLPINAYRKESWWSNSPNTAHARAWLEAGWEMQEVNLKEGYVVFRKAKNVKTEARTEKKPRTIGIEKPFTPVPARHPRPKKPSKTKISKLYARIKNLERQRTAMPQYRGNFKPKHEKKLFKPHEKP